MVKIIIFFTAQLKQIRGLKQLAMTTNGLTLSRQLPALKNAGLDVVNISLDTLKESEFEHFTRRKGWTRVMKAIETAVDLGYDPVKVIIV